MTDNVIPIKTALAEKAMAPDTAALERLGFVGPSALTALDAILNGTGDAQCVDLTLKEFARKGLNSDEAASVLTDRNYPVSAGVLKGRTIAQARDYIVERYAQVYPEALLEKNWEWSSSTPNPKAEDVWNTRKALAMMGVEMRWNEFVDRPQIKMAGEADFHTMREWTRADLLIKMASRFQLKNSEARIKQVIISEAKRNSTHPVCEYLDALQWDGKKRLDNWLVTYGAAEDSPYVRAVSALVLIAAVRRVRQPGCQFDTALIMEGKQGCGKSTACRILAKDEPRFFEAPSGWFLDSLKIGSDAKVVLEHTAGKWLIELQELRGKMSEIESVKAFISTREDHARTAYAAEARGAPRQFVMIGTTNNRSYLKDGTGGRRFLPVQVGKFDLDGLARDVDQLWAEATAREATGEAITLPEHLWDVQRELTETATIDHPYVEMLEAKFGDAKGYIRSVELPGLLNLVRPTQPDSEIIEQSMQRLGFEKTRLRVEEGQVWCWWRGDKSVRIMDNATM